VRGAWLARPITHMTPVSQRLPPGPGFRVLESAGFQLAAPRLLEACRRRYGDAVTFGNLFDERFMMVSDPDLAKRVLQGSNDHVHAGDQLRTWIACSSPRLTRCNNARRETPRVLTESTIRTQPAGACSTNSDRSWSPTRIRREAPGVSRARRWTRPAASGAAVEGATPSCSAPCRRRAARHAVAARAGSRGCCGVAIMLAACSVSIRRRSRPHRAPSKPPARVLFATLSEHGLLAVLRA
jgi:hypothetical protein